MTMTTHTSREANPLLKAMRDAVRKEGRPYLHAHRDPTAPSYVRDRAIFTLTVSHDMKDHASRKTVVEGIPGWIKNGHTDTIEVHTREPGSLLPGDRSTWETYSEVFEPQRGYWSLFACDTFPSALESLPAYAEVSFVVGTDFGTTENMIKARMHGDILYLKATWKQGTKEITRSFMLDFSVGPHNSARFGNSSGDK